MNPISIERLNEANRQAILNLYLYLAHGFPPSVGMTVKDAVEALSQRSADKRMTVLKSAILHDTELSDLKILEYTYSYDGLSACVFEGEDEASVVYKGTGRGEWIDNGEGLSGIAQKNTYIEFENAKPVFSRNVNGDHASSQQVQALNWFSYVSSKHNFESKAKIIISGHSKGGNKAQFAAMYCRLPFVCYSFDGQGFSPEALKDMSSRLGESFFSYRENVFSLSAQNDYVNVLGERLMPQNNIYFFSSQGGFHPIEAMLDDSGLFRQQTEQGALSKYMQDISDRIMALPSDIRQYATRGVMNVFQKYLGKSTAVNGDYVSTADTISGIGIALAAVLDI